MGMFAFTFHFFTLCKTFRDFPYTKDIDHEFVFPKDGEVSMKE